jgi:hypothetical protein
MKKKYFIFLFFALIFFITQKGFAQISVNTDGVAQNIEDLSIYPNPVTNGKVFIYISSKQNLTKKVDFFDVLGKQIYSTQLTGKELNISTLSKGVYILKITENNISETRKLVIK